MLFFLLLVLISGCKKDDRQNPSANMIPFPLVVGNSWKYYSESTLSTTDESSTSKLYSYWTVASDTIINSEEAFIVIRSDTNFNGNTCQSKTFYAIRTDGLYALGYQNSCDEIAWFKNGNHLLIPSIFGIFSLNKNKGDSIIAENALFLLKYPVVFHESWNSMEFGPMRHVKREWLGIDTVDTNLGEIVCNKLRVYQDSTEFPVIYQYISDQGLIMEELFMEVSSSTGTGTFTRETILQEIKDQWN